MTTGRINQVTIFGGRPPPGGRRALGLGERPGVVPREGRGSEDRARPAARRGREPAVRRSTIQLPQPSSPRWSPPKRPGHPRGGHRSSAWPPQVEVTHPRSRQVRRLPVHGHAPECVRDSVGQRPPIHRLLRRRPDCGAIGRASGTPSDPLEGQPAGDGQARVRLRNEPPEAHGDKGRTD
jgi:hypothetical protein